MHESETKHTCVSSTQIEDQNTASSQKSPSVSSSSLCHLLGNHDLNFSYPREIIPASECLKWNPLCIALLSMASFIQHHICVIHTLAIQSLWWLYTIPPETRSQSVYPSTVDGHLTNFSWAPSYRLIPWTLQLTSFVKHRHAYLLSIH